MNSKDMQLTINKEITSDRVSHGSRSRTRAFCVICGKRVRLITPLETEQIYRANWVEILKVLEKSEIHRIHNSNGSILICANSLLKARLGKRKKTFVVLKPFVFSTY
ncbi:MAG: hypothetical protein ACT4O9_00335 [Blastocatellia bacterium]